MHYYQDNFHETKQIRAYDIGSLIANIGGYIGMFLGYALLNLPRFFITVGESIKRGLRDIRGSTLTRAKTHTTNNLEDVSEPFVKIEN